MTIHPIAGSSASSTAAAVFAGASDYNATGTWGFAGSVIAIAVIGAIVLRQIRRHRD